MFVIAYTSSKMDKIKNLPLEYPKLLKDQLNNSPKLLQLRCSAISNINHLKPKRANQLSVCDTILDYTSYLLSIFYDQDSIEFNGSNERDILELDLSVSIINAAYIYREISLETMQRAYGSESQDSYWGSSGDYLKNGLGLLQYLQSLEERNFLHISPTYYSIIVNLSSEFKIIQQLGIVVLALSKLRSKMYGSSRDGVLDLQNQDIQELSKTSILYTKLIIGCSNFSNTLSRDSMFNKALSSYLESLTLLLLSMDQYQKDQCGIAIGMIDEATNILSTFIPSSKLHDSFLLKTRKRDTIKNIFKNPTSTERSNILMLDKIRHNESLHPLLGSTLDDFIIPLYILLRYRYQQTNDKLTFQPVEKDKAKLHSYYPQGKEPQLEGAAWVFNGHRLKEINSSTSLSGNSLKYF